MRQPRISINLILWLVLLLGGSAVFASDDGPSQARAVLERYLKLPHPNEDRLGDARLARLRTLDELKSMPETALKEIARVLPEVKEPRQRAELAEVLRYFPTKESAAKLCELLDDMDERVRWQAIHSLRSMTRRVDRSGAQRRQHGGAFEPRVAGLVPQLIKAAGDKAEMNRVAALYALADTLDSAAVAEIRRHLDDENAQVRFHAACFLTETQDASGLSQMRQALARLRSGSGSQVTYAFDAELLLASFQRITGKSFGELPQINPMLDGDGRSAQESTQRYKELLDTWAAWWAWEPAAH